MRHSLAEVRTVKVDDESKLRLENMRKHLYWLEGKKNEIESTFLKVTFAYGGGFGLIAAVGHTIGFSNSHDAEAGSRAFGILISGPITFAAFAAITLGREYLTYRRLVRECRDEITEFGR